MHRYKGQDVIRDYSEQLRDKDLTGGKKSPLLSASLGILTHYHLITSSETLSGISTHH